MNPACTICVPRLSTERLTLREYRAADFNCFADHLSDPDSAAHLGVADCQTAWRIFSSQAGLWLLGGAGWWSVEDRHSGQLLGSVGAFYRHDDTVLEMGWNTYRPFGGKGIACEAAAAVMEYAFTVRRVPKVRALIAAGNTGSRRVAERLGMRYEMDIELHGAPIGCYTRERAASP